MSEDPELLTFTLGETWVITASAFDAAGGALSLVGALGVEFRVASWPFRQTADAVLLASASVGSGITVTSAAGGLCNIVISPELQTSAIAGRHRYQWWVTTAGAVEIEQEAGEIIINPSIRSEFP